MSTEKGDSLARPNVAMDDVAILWDAIDNGQSDIPALALALQRAVALAMALTESNI